MNTGSHLSLVNRSVHGFSFDLDKADKLTAKLTSIRAELKDELQQMVAPKVEEMKSPAGWTVEGYTAPTKAKLKLLLKDAGLKQSLVNDAVKTGNKQKTTLFNPGSRQQIAASTVRLRIRSTKGTRCYHT